MVEKEEHVNAWNLFRQGSTESFEKIYDFYFHLLLNYGAKFTHDIEIAEDAVQDLFIKLWSNRLNINETNSVKNYLYKSYRRIIVAKLSALKSIEHAELTEDTLEFDFEISYEQMKIDSEDFRSVQLRVQKALSLMNNRQKEVLYLKFYEELPYEQIADLMDLTQKSAYKLVYRALDKLKEIMQEQN